MTIVRIPRTESLRERDNWRDTQDSDNNNKANKVVGGVEDNIATLTSDGDIQDSGYSFDDVQLRNASTQVIVNDYTVLENDGIIWADASGGNIIVTLQPSTSDIYGRTSIIEKIDTSSNTVTVKGDGTELINGENTFVLLFEYESIEPTACNVALTGSDYLI